MITVEEFLDRYYKDLPYRLPRDLNELEELHSICKHLIKAEGHSDVKTLIYTRPIKIRNKYNAGTSLVFVSQNSHKLYSINNSILKRIESLNKDATSASINDNNFTSSNSISVPMKQKSDINNTQKLLRNKLIELEHNLNPQIVINLGDSIGASSGQSRVSIEQIYKYIQSIMQSHGKTLPLVILNKSLSDICIQKANSPLHPAIFNFKVTFTTILRYYLFNKELYINNKKANLGIRPGKTPELESSTLNESCAEITKRLKNYQV